MNAHQRRVRSRRLHMDLPLGKEVVLRPRWPFQTTRATVFRHTPRVAPYRVDIRHAGFDDRPATISQYLLSDVQLKNPTDRAPRPWWAGMNTKGMK